jgi:hypothetical protein
MMTTMEQQAITTWTYTRKEQIHNWSGLWEGCFFYNFSLHSVGQKSLKMSSETLTNWAWKEFVNQNFQQLYGLWYFYVTIFIYCRLIYRWFYFCLLKKTHISALPAELLMYIFKWVVSQRLDLRSLERIAQVKDVHNKDMSSPRTGLSFD